MKKSFLSLLIVLLFGCSSSSNFSTKTDLYPFISKKSNKWGFLDAHGNQVISPRFSRLKKLPFSGKLMPAKKGHKWGFINRNGQFVIKPKYLDVKDFSWSDNGTTPVTELSGKASYYIDNQGKKVIVPQGDYHSLFPFSEGLARVRTHSGKWGFIDDQGREVIKAQFDYVDSFREGLALVSIDSKYSYIDKSGKLLFPLEFDYALDFKDGRALVGKDNNYQIVSSNGEVIKNLEEINMGASTNLCDTYKGYSEGLLGIAFGNEKLSTFEQCSFIDKEGNIVIEPKFDEVGQFSEGLASVRINRKWGFIDKEGNIVIEPKFEEVKPFKNELAIAIGRRSIISGYINKKGKYVLKYTEYHPELLTSFFTTFP